MTKEYFYKRLEEVHPNKGYVVENLPEVFTNKINVEVSCPKHGKFTISIVNLLNGRQCKLCNKEEKGEDGETFRKKYIEKYGENYECDISEYKNLTGKKINFFCKKHNYHFKQTPYESLNYMGCKCCASEKMIDGVKKHNETTKKERYDSLFEKIKEKYGKEIKIEEDSFTSINNSLKIFCKKHGWVDVDVSSLLNSKRKIACPKCIGKGRKRITFEDFKKECIEKFGDIYDFSKSSFTNMRTKITVGYNGKFFEVTPSKLLAQEKDTPLKHSRIENYIEAIEKIKEKHGNKYDLSLITEENYHGSHNYVPLICEKHGLFHARVNILINGGSCPKCRESKLQSELANFLNEKKVIFIEEYPLEFTFNKCSYKRLDFFLPEYNIGIECQGLQHFKPIDFYGGEEGFKYRIGNDIDKFNKCKDNGIALYYIKPKKGIEVSEIKNNQIFNDIYSHDNIFTNAEDILNTILYKFKCSPSSDYEFKGE